MDRKTFTAQVLAQLRHLTPEEKDAVCQELEGHMEDRVEGMVELGFSREIAEERTLAAMGDPVEIGREMDRQYPPGWLWLGRAAFILTTVMCIFAALGFGVWGFTIDSITARFFPPVVATLNKTEASMPVDIRIPVGNDILRVCQISVGWDGKRVDKVAEVSLCSYDRIPGGIVSHEILCHVLLRNQRGEMRWDDVKSSMGTLTGGGHAKREQGSVIIPIQPGDTNVTLEYDYLGESFFIELPLPKEVSP